MHINRYCDLQLSKTREPILDGQEIIEVVPCRVGQVERGVESCFNVDFQFFQDVGAGDLAELVVEMSVCGE